MFWLDNVVRSYLMRKVDINTFLMLLAANEIDHQLRLLMINRAQHW